MNHLARLIGCSLILLLCGCAQRVMRADSRNPVAVEFVGSTPAGAMVREFLGGLESDAPCHSITWRVALFTNQHGGQPATFSLNALHHVPARGNTNQSQDGPRVAAQGTWEIIQRDQPAPESVIYRLHSAKPQRALSLVKLGDSLLHVLNPDGSLAVGDGGESYTLNRADRAETPGDTSRAMGAPSISYKISPLATGPTVFGVFEGRTPCLGISRELKISQSAACIKAKWRVTLFQNPETRTPSAYKVEGSLFREGAREGTWSVTQGAALDSKAAVYQLHPAQNQPALLLWKADDNVLFFLNQNRELLIGHADFSYTLNRRTMAAAQ